MKSKFPRRFAPSQQTAFESLYFSQSSKLLEDQNLSFNEICAIIVDASKANLAKDDNYSYFKNKFCSKYVERSLDLLKDFNSFLRDKKTTKFDYYSFQLYYSFSPCKLIDIIESFSKLGYKLPYSFLEQWEIAFKSQIKHFTPKMLSTALRSISYINLEPTDSFLRIWENYASKNIDGFDTKDLTASINAFRTMNIKPSPFFLNAWSHSVTNQIHNFDSKDVSNCIYNIATMKALGFINLAMPKALAVKAKCLILYGSIDKNIKSLHQIYISNLTQHFLSKKAEKLAKNKLKKLKFMDEEHISKFEKDISFSIENAFPKLKFTKNYYDNELFGSIDMVTMFFKNSTQVKCAVQIDGPFHYNCYGKLNISSMYNSLLLKQLGYEVIRISYKEAEYYNNHYKLSNSQISSLKKIMHIEKHCNYSLGYDYKNYDAEFNCLVGESNNYYEDSQC